MILGRLSCFLDGCFWPLVLRGTPLGGAGCLGNPYFLFTGCLSIQVFASPPFFNSRSGHSGYLLLTVKHLYDLYDVIPCHSSPDASHPPITASAMDLRECFLLSELFYLTLLPAAFKVSLGLAVHLQR